MTCGGCSAPILFPPLRLIPWGSIQAWLRSAVLAPAAPENLYYRKGILQFSSTLGIPSLWGNRFYLYFLPPYIPVLHFVYSGRKIDKGFFKQMVILSYMWCADAPVVIRLSRPAPFISRFGLGGIGGSWVPIPFTHFLPREFTQSCGDCDCYKVSLTAGMRRMTSVRVGLCPPSRLLEANGPSPVA